MDERDRYIRMNENERIMMESPPQEVNEIEIMRLGDLIRDKKTIGIWAFVVQRPVEEFPERLSTHQTLIATRMGAGDLLELAHSSVIENARRICETFLEEDDDA